jgi:hypothetical protein
MGLSLHPYAVLRRLIPLALATIVAVPALQAQERRHELITRVERSAKSTGYGLLTTARAVTMSVDMKAFHEAATGSQLLLAGVPLTKDRAVDLDLREFSVLTKDSKVTYTDDAGRHPFEDLSVRTYAGTIKGDPKSEVYLAFADHSIVGVVSTNGTTYEIATDFSAEKNPGTLAAVTFPMSDLRDQKFACGVKDTPFSKDELDALDASQHGLLSVETCPSIIYALKGAWDADYEFYQDWQAEGGGREGAASYMISLIAGMSRIYERDARVQIVVSALNVWTTPSDLYNESTFMPIALDEAQGVWNTAYANVDRGFAQVMSGKNWSGIIGIANGFDLICDPSESITFQLIKKWDPIGGIQVLSHELGHLTGLRHTHSCTWNPAIDQCAAAESGSCFSGTTLSEGTIMSYCKQLRMVFHERQIPFLRQRTTTWNACTGDARKLEIARELLHYPVVDVGNPIDSTFPFFFLNHSKSDVTVTRMQLTGDVYQQFEIVEPQTPFVVRSCDSIGLRLLFKATRDTTHRAELLIFHDGLNVNYGQEQHFRVDVEAFAKDDKPAFGFRSVGNQIINFGRTKVDATIDTVFKAPKELFINIGTAPLRVDSTAIVGPDRFEFELIEGSAPFVLAPVTVSGNKRPATIRFSPKTPGIKEAYLKVWSNSPGNEQDSLHLTAEVLRGPVLELKVADFVIDFGEVLAERVYTKSFDDFFYNNGTEPLSINAGVAGTDAELFPGATWLDEVAPGEGIPLDISFFADDTVSHGWKTAMILIASNTPKGLDTVQVTAKIVGSAAAPGADVSETAAFMIVPNPTKADADIYIAPAAGELGREYTLRIIDGNGKEVRRLTGRFTVEGIRTQLHGGELPSGVYYVSVTTDKGMRSHAVTVSR